VDYLEDWVESRQVVLAVGQDGVVGAIGVQFPQKTRRRLAGEAAVGEKLAAARERVVARHAQVE